MSYRPMFYNNMFPGEPKKVANPLTVEAACLMATKECSLQVVSADRVSEAWMMMAPVIEFINEIPSITNKHNAEERYRDHLRAAPAFETMCRATRLNASGSQQSEHSLSDYWYHRYLQSDHWNNKRREAYEGFGGECRACCAEHHLEVHHRHYKTLGREHIKQDLLLLCATCHRGVHEAHDIRPPYYPPNEIREIVGE